ncbi:MAG: hypothetical protein ACYCQJ_04990 [Nitrososphaerales archaeon]
MNRTRQISIVAMFSSLILATDFGLASIPNVKLMDTLVFAASYSFGFKLGAYIAIVSELAWSFVSPNGVAGIFTPILVGCELLFALAGWIASKTWSIKNLSWFSTTNVFFGSLMLVTAFFWDFITNAAYAVSITWPNVSLFSIIAAQVSGALFMFNHEIADFVFGAFLSTIVILYSQKVNTRYEPRIPLEHIQGR